MAINNEQPRGRPLSRLVVGDSAWSISDLVVLSLDLWLSLGYPCLHQASTTSQQLSTAQAASHVLY